MPLLVNIAGKLIPTSHFPMISDIVGKTTNQQLFYEYTIICVEKYYSKKIFFKLIKYMNTPWLL